jgi:peptide/nickel transport system permease protein
MLKKYPVIGYYVKKIFGYVLTIWGALTVTFLLFRLIPTNPIESWVRSLEQQYSVGIEGGENMAEFYMEQFGLTGSLWEQYWRYLYNVIIKRDLGPSFVNFPTPVQELLWRRLPWTLGLLTVSISISWVLGLLIGAIAAWNRDTWAADALTNVSIALSQVPPYLIALFLVLFLGYQWGLLPTRGAWDAQYEIGFTWDFIKSVISHSILPALSIIIVSLASWILSTRSLVVSNLGEDYLLYAEAKGLKPSNIMIGYALRNALLPQATGLALTLGTMMNGQLLIELTFVYPGLGELMSRAIQVFDYNTMMGIIILSVIAVMTASLVVDLLLPVLDPRVRTAIST